MNRRGFVGGIAASAAALMFAGVFSDARAAQSFRGIVVDTRPLEARGGGMAASVIRQQLQASLKRELAGRVGRSGPTLTVRIETVFLASYAGDGGGGRRASGSTGSDWLDGVVIAGEQRFPMFVTQHPSVGGAWYLPQSEVNRLRALADQYAGWVARKV